MARTRKDQQKQNLWQRASRTSASKRTGNRRRMTGRGRGRTSLAARSDARPLSGAPSTRVASEKLLVTCWSSRSNFDSKTVGTARILALYPSEKGQKLGAFDSMGTVRHAPPGCAQGVLTSMRRGFACSALGMCSFSTPSASSAVAFSVSSSEVSGKTERVRPRHQRQGHRRRSGRDPDVARSNRPLQQGQREVEAETLAIDAEIDLSLPQASSRHTARRHFRVPGWALAGRETRRGRPEQRA